MRAERHRVSVAQLQFRFLKTQESSVPSLGLFVLEALAPRIDMGSRLVPVISRLPD